MKNLELEEKTKMKEHDKKVLQKKLKEIPGLEDKLSFLGQVKTWSHLGSLDALEWTLVKEFMLQKRYWVRADFDDLARLGPGHMNSFDLLHYRAREKYLQSLSRRTTGGDEC